MRSSASSAAGLALLGALLGACETPPVVPPPDSGVVRPCRTLTGPVSTLAQASTRLHALPAPATVPCFVESLPRPLTVVATRGTLSAQPAAGSNDPRLLILSGQLVITVVAQGASAELIEFGEWVTPTRTLKGEASLPRDGGVPELDPLVRPRRNAVTSLCAICHRGELPSDVVDGGFVSAAFQPDFGTEVPLSTVRAQYDGCVAAQDTSSRCELYRALFDPGGVSQGAFSPTVERFIQ